LALNYNKVSKEIIRKDTMTEFNALEFLRNYRDRKKLSMEQLAAETKIHSQTLYKLFSGETKEMSVATKQKIAEFLATIM